jgi:hypothetical protein
MSDSLYQGRRFRTLNILDEGVREALAIEIDTSLPAQRVVRTLQQLEAWRGLPKAIRLDNVLNARGDEPIGKSIRGRVIFENPEMTKNKQLTSGIPHYIGSPN